MRSAPAPDREVAAPQKVDRILKKLDDVGGRHDVCALSCPTPFRLAAFFAIASISLGSGKWLATVSSAIIAVNLARHGAGVQRTRVALAARRNPAGAGQAD
jgi:hypothetical protein